MKIIQCLTVMMTVVVYGASLHSKNELLGEICCEAKRIRSLPNLPSNVLVAKPSGNSHSICVKHFFCLAEKALEEVPDKHKMHVEKLIRQLQQYNKKINDQNCVLNETTQCTLRSFLEYIIKCSERCGTCKKKECECKNMKHKQ